MKKQFLLLCIVFFTLTSINAQNFKLSAYSEISVITCGTGEELYSAFGHSAFRVKDPVYRMDLVYNYGTFNFNTPNFYLKFARGKLLYELDRSRYNDFIQLYIEENRWVKEQVLDLTAEEKNALFLYLENNLKPENKSYKYDFFFNNCATKIRDVVEEALPNKVVFNEDHVDEERTFRELIQLYVNQNSWGSFGIDLCLGAVIDRNANAREFMFLPDYVLAAFENGTINNGKKLVKSSKELLTQKEENSYSTSFFTSPLFVVLILSVIILLITYRDYKKQRRSRLLDFSLLFITGLLGIFLLLLWFATDHTATANNFNILWAFAPNLLMSFLILKKTPPTWMKKYISFLLILILVSGLFWVLGIQFFPIVIVPLLIALMVRYWYVKRFLVA